MKLFLIIIFATRISKFSSNVDSGLSCGPTISTSSQELWPRSEDGTCSLSIPGCVDAKNNLQIRCCKNGIFDNVSCTPDFSQKDPRCFDGMESTVADKSLNICYAKIDTIYPFACSSNTGEMMTIDTKLLSEIGGIDNKIWLPLTMFGNTFRYTSRNDLYMVSHSSLQTSNAYCMTLFKDSYEVVSCHESHLGVCKDYPYIIYNIPMDQVNILLQSVRTFCDHTDLNVFCIFYGLMGQLSIAYFSSRKYISGEYIYLQKKNLRIVLQIRHNGLPFSHKNVFLYVALSEEDWNIFNDKSEPFSVYDANDESLFQTPEIEISMKSKSIHVEGKYLHNIKSTQQDSVFVYCFFNASPTFNLDRFDAEIGKDIYYNLTQKTGSVWCDAFDHDLQIIRSNVINVQSQNDQSAFISKLRITLFDTMDCAFDMREVLNNLIRDAMQDENDFNYNILLKSCYFQEYKTVEVTVEWFSIEPAENPEQIEEKFSKMRNIIENMQKLKNNVIQIYIEFLGHANYCLKDVTYFANQPFIWPTTPKEEIVSSQPFCYQLENESSTVLKRKCSYSDGVSCWMDVKPCFPETNMTIILQQLSLFEEGNTKNKLVDLNILVENHFDSFVPFDISLMSKILLPLTNSRNDDEINWGILPNIISNLYHVENEVLKKSQKEYNATDSILDTLTNIYDFHKNTEQFRSDYYSNILIDLTRTGKVSNAASFSIQLPCDITSSLVFYNNFDSYSNEHVVLSIFSKDYLFNSDISTVHTESTIFQALTPDQKDSRPFTVLTTNLNSHSNQFCACWRYAIEFNSLRSSRWQKTTILKKDGRSICVFKTFFYCAVFNRNSEIEYQYISELSTKYHHQISSLVYPPYFVPVALNEILNKVISAELDISVAIEVVDEYDPLNDSKNFIVNWNLLESSETAQDIDVEFDRMSKLIHQITSLSNEVITEVEVKYIRHKKFCRTHTTDAGTFTWPITVLDGSTEAVPKCYFSRQGGIQSHVRKCLGNTRDGAFWEDLQPCSLFPNVTETLDYMITNFNYTTANDVLQDLDNLTRDVAQYFVPTDVLKVAEIFVLLSNVTDKIELNLTTLSSVTSSMQTLDESVLRNAQLIYNATDQILYNLDRIFLTTDISKSYSLNNSEYYVVGLSNCTMCKGVILYVFEDSYKVTILEEDINYDELVQDENFETAIVFSNNLLEDIRNSANVSVIISIFFKSVLFNDADSIRKVTKVFGILIRNYDKDVFPGSIELIFRNNINPDDCAYWEYGMKNGTPIIGTWKNESNLHIEKKFSMCEFNHTTHFAMLIADVYEKADFLDLITDIGCSLSLIGLCGILITGLIFERWRRNIGNVILLHFVLTMFIQIFLFYLSRFVNVPFHNIDLCIFTGALLHYSVISEFCWMLIISILQFKRFVQVLTGPPKYLLFKSLFIGWILPLIPVVSVLIFDENSYTSGVTGLCYPSKLGLYLGVWLPVFTIILINFIIFSYIMYSIFHRKTECIDTVTNEIVFQWRLAFLLFFMLGLTWSFAFIGQFILPDLFLFLFCLSAPLQGFVMFLFFIVFDTRTRLMYMTLFKKILKKYTN